MFKKKFRKIMALWKCGESVEGVWKFSTESPTPCPSPVGRGVICTANCRRLWRPRRSLSKGISSGGLRPPQHQVEYILQHINTIIPCCGGRRPPPLKQTNHTAPLPTGEGQGVGLSGAFVAFVAFMFFSCKYRLCSKKLLQNKNRL